MEHSAISRDDVVIVRRVLSTEEYEAFQRLQALCGHETIEQTVREGLALHGVLPDANGVFRYHETADS